MIDCVVVFCKLGADNQEDQIMLKAVTNRAKKKSSRRSLEKGNGERKLFPEKGEKVRMDSLTQQQSTNDFYSH